MALFLNARNCQAVFLVPYIWHDMGTWWALSMPICVERMKMRSVFSATTAHTCDFEEVSLPI